MAERLKQGTHGGSSVRSPKKGRTTFQPEDAPDYENRVGEAASAKSDQRAGERRAKRRQKRYS